MFLRGDGGVQLQELMEVFGRLKEAGVERVGIVAQERRAQHDDDEPMDAVSEVLIARAPKGDGLELDAGRVGDRARRAGRGCSCFVPAWWFGAQSKPPETIMQISLGGPIGPNDGGLATLGGRTIQQVVPVEAKKPIEPVRPPAAKTPEMIEPTKAPPKKTTPNKVDAKDPRSTRADEGRGDSEGLERRRDRRQGHGLRAVVGRRRHRRAPRSLELLLPGIPRRRWRRSVKSNWDSQQGAAGRRALAFVIQKDGRIVDITVEQSSGVETLDFYARRALMLTQAAAAAGGVSGTGAGGPPVFRISALRTR